MSQLNDVFRELRGIMLPYVEELDFITDHASELSVNTHHTPTDDDAPLWFGGVKVTKDAVRYYLMPLHNSPALLAEVSPELKAHMHEDGYFQFSEADPALFAEVANLTKLSYQDYVDKGYIA